MAIDFASSFFGSGGAASFFSIGQSSGPTEAQAAAKAIITAQKREINRIRGYKEDLSPAENQQLSEIQAKVQAIEKRSGAGIVRQDELDDRIELLADADRIIGKPIANVEAEDQLAEYSQTLDLLLKPKLDPVAARRVDSLQRIKDTLESNLGDNPESATLRAQFQNLSSQLDAQNPSRAISELSLSERNAYDDLAELINDAAGVEIQLDSRDTLRVAELEASILELQSQIGADASQQPTTSQVNRAYTRLL